MVRGNGGNSDQIYSGNRLIGVNYIDLGDGDNLLDLSGQSNSLAEEAMVIKVGSGQDTLWLSDGHENVDTGAGNDNIIVNGGIDRILFDNFTPQELKEGLNIVPQDIETEASGGITLENIHGYLETGINAISIGALTHQIKSKDIRLEFIN